LSRIATAGSDAADDVERRAIEDPDFLVVAVGDVELPLVGREGDVPHRTVAGCGLRDERLLDELAVLLEYLDAVVLAIADVHGPVLRHLHAAHRAELPGRRRARIVRRRLGLARLLAVRAPAAFECAGRRIEDDDAAIAHVGAE